MTAVAADPTTAVRERMADAASRGKPLRIVGRGTWLDAGRPVRATERLSIRECSGITEYVPGDLTLTARAGTTLAEIADATRRNAQWLVLDPPGTDDVTIGATVATASAGALRAAFGSPRDLVLGLEFVTGRGVVARSGGRVVKNVAGFDITKLLTGSWGTLAAITEVTVRLHAKPEVDETIAVVLENRTPGRVRELLRSAPFAPYACEILNDALAAVVLDSQSPTVLFRLGGNAEAVRAQRRAVTSLGESREMGSDVWARLRRAEPDGAIVFRLSRLPTEMDATWGDATAVAATCPGAMVHASPARGVVRCIVPRSGDAESSLSTWFRTASGARRIGERMPATLWPLCAPTVVADRLSQGVKAAFDPRGILNPGILGDPA